MNPELYFIYDSHCPWSFAGSALVNALAEAYPEMEIHAWHCAYYDGSDGIRNQQINEVTKNSNIKFTKSYLQSAAADKDSSMVANLMAWLSNKQQDKVLPVLTALQNEHFASANPFTSKDDFSGIIEQFKLSPPNKVFKDELSNEAQYILSDIAELQKFMGTDAFPALLLTQDDRAVLLDHSRYLKKPQAIVNAVKKELKD